jgi:V8-like Glu-specific endopeptidase
MPWRENQGRDRSGDAMANLSGADIQELSKKLSTALNFNTLEMYTQGSTGDRLYVEYVGKDDPLKPMISKLLNALEENGITCKFLQYVYHSLPHRGDVRELISRFCPVAAAPIRDAGVELSAQIKGEPQPDAPVSAAAPGLQRNVRPHLTKVDLRVWLERLMQIERRVCRIEVDDNAAGTGFLVGPDTVLTNWHVVEKTKAAGDLAKIGCRFGYLRLSNGTRQQGVRVPLHAAGLIDSSPYSDSEKAEQADGPPPTLEQLDYALLRLAEPAGKQQVDGAERGWVALPEQTPELKPGAPILIVQHPDGAPMKLALDTDAVIAVNETRIRYATNTAPGSSGSPCFTMDWDLAVLHNYGDPAWKAPKFNQGVPIGMVRKRIVARGFGSALGA